MAAPPSYAWIAIKDIPETFIVALAAQEYSTVPDDYDTEQATKRSLPVGLVMFTNVLSRNNRNFISILDTLNSKDLIKVKDDNDNIVGSINPSKVIKVLFGG